MNDLDALAAVDSSQTLAELLDEIQKPTYWQGKRNRSLHPFGEPDVSLGGVHNRRVHYYAKRPPPRAASFIATFD
jgi:hypothetical protein